MKGHHGHEACHCCPAKCTISRMPFTLLPISFWMPRKNCGWTYWTLCLGEIIDHPCVLTKHEVKKVISLWVVSGNCGVDRGYDSLMIKRANAQFKELKSDGAEINFAWWKGKSFFEHSGYPWTLWLAIQSVQLSTSAGRIQTSHKTLPLQRNSSTITSSPERPMLLSIFTPCIIPSWTAHTHPVHWCISFSAFCYLDDWNLPTT